VPDDRTSASKRVTIELSIRQHADLSAAAKQVDMPSTHLARLFIAFCLMRLAAGDAELQRAVKGSRDASTG
jgi:hypothetical protein